jgi:hypothetical protein
MIYEKFEVQIASPITDAKIGKTFHHEDAV